MLFNLKKVPPVASSEIYRLLSGMGAKVVQELSYSADWHAQYEQKEIIYQIAQERDRLMIVSLPEEKWKQLKQREKPGQVKKRELEEFQRFGWQPFVYLDYCRDGCLQKRWNICLVKKFPFWEEVVLIWWGAVYQDSCHKCLLKEALYF